MARYVASVIFPDGQQLQTSAKGYGDDHTTGVLRMEAIEGMVELVALTREGDDEAAEVAEAFDQAEDE